METKRKRTWKPKPPAECANCKRIMPIQCIGLCQTCYERQRIRSKCPKVGTLRLLCPGDWLEVPGTERRIGFIWEIDVDRVEVRSYEGPGTRGPTIRRMTRAEACWYRIIPNDRYGVERPLLGVK